MAAVTPTLSQLQAWGTDHLTDAAISWTRAATHWEATFTQLSRRVGAPGGTPWLGVAADAAQQRAHGDRMKVLGIADQLRDAADIARNGAGEIRAVQQAALRMVEAARQAGFTVSEDFAVSSRDTGSPQYLAARMRKALGLSADIHAKVADLLEAEERVAQRISTATMGLDASFFKDGPGDVMADQARRHENQIAAFRQLFGRDPVSETDWSTAAALDPHTYEAIFDGTGSEVRVVRINPIPGQGEVRVSQWISQRDVIGWPLWTDDLGNNRGPDVNFHPEDTKVTTYIDYENGVVIMRQNPSVLEGTGEVRVGKPAGSVSQRPDGSVRIKYDAGNPFAPGASASPTGPMSGHQVTVNGDLVFTPGAGGVRVDGTRTDYPSMEVYQDMSDGTTRTVLIDPAESGRSWGPMLNLPFHHDVGSGGNAFAPFDTGGYNPTYDVPAPLPAIPFGPVTNAPSVPRSPAMA